MLYDVYKGTSKELYSVLRKSNQEGIIDCRET